MALRFVSFEPLVIKPSAKSARPSVWCIPVITARDATSTRETTNGSRYIDRPKPRLPMTSPITIPTIGNRYMFFAMELSSEFAVGIIVRNENTEPICLSNYNRLHQRYE